MPFTKPVLRRGVVVAVIAAVIATVLAVAPGSAPRADAFAGGCSYQTSRLVGRLWADSHFNSSNERFFFRSRNSHIVADVRDTLDALDISFTEGVSDEGHITFRFGLPGYDAGFYTTHPGDDPLVACDRDAFLASLIEGEGSPEGKIIDDPDSRRLTIASDLATDFGLPNEIRRDAVWVDEVYWPRLEALPFITCGRVPGRGTYCTPDRTPPPDPPAVGVLIEDGSDWRWQRSPQSGSAWRSTGFNDGSWRLDAAPLGFGQPVDQSDVGVGKPSYFFRHEFDADGPVDALDLSIVRDDGAVIYLNGVEVARTNMPPGAITPDTFAVTRIGGEDETRWVDIAIDGSALVDGTNVLAVQVHQTNSRSSDLSFDLELSGSDGDVPSADPGVTVFAGPNFDASGTSAVLAIGEYRAEALGSLNNDIESIRVGAGLQVTMCLHSGGRGDCVTITSDDSRLPSTHANKVSYLLVEPLGA